MKWISVASSVLALVSTTASADTHPVRAELVAEAQVARNAATRIGVRFVMEPGWHIYWANPGESGLATEVAWEIPAGVAVGPLVWPAPGSFSSPGDITSFGYSDEVVLASRLEWPGRPVAGAIRARASWLACRERCLLGDALLAADLPLAADAIDPEAFATFDQMLPRPLPADDAPFTAHVETTRGLPRVWLSWLDTPLPIDIFPLAPAPHRVRFDAVTRGGLTRINLIPVGARPSAVALVLAVGHEGRRSTYRLDLTTNDTGRDAGTKDTP